MTTKSGHPPPPAASAEAPLTQEVKHTVASYFARIHLQNAERQGMDTQALMAQAQLPASLLQEPGARIAPQQLAALFQAMWQVNDDEYLGLTQSPRRIGVFTLLTERMVQCETLGQALKEAIRFYRLTDNDFNLVIEQQDKQVLLHIRLQHPELDYQNILTELLLLIWHRFPSWLVKQVIPLHEIHFRFKPPSHKEEYRLLYPGPCRFSQPDNTLVWPAEVLDWPIRRNTEQLLKYLNIVPLPWFRKQEFVETVTDQVSRLLEEGPTDHLITLNDIAAQLHTTARTLRRKLTSEGSSFQRLKDNVRRDRAIYWLSLEDISIAEVGRRSGYTEATAFIRAFKSWTGVSPGDYRRRLLKTS
jgi:AraC-like DNA-binding protein